jgi:hypothetical protein
MISIGVALSRTLQFFGNVTLPAISFLLLQNNGTLLQEDGSKLEIE